MNIGIDIDGVIIDIEEFKMECGSKMCIEESWGIDIKPDEYYVSKTFNWTEEQDEKFWKRYLLKYAKGSIPRRYSAEIIEKLRQEGNKIYIITARNQYGMPEEETKSMQEITKEWLDRNNIKYDNLIFAGDEEKRQQCLDNNIDVMIEDSPKNIKNISEKVPVIKFYNTYNNDVKGPNIRTAYSWYEIYNIISSK